MSIQPLVNLERLMKLQAKLQKTGKVMVVVAVMSILREKDVNCRALVLEIRGLLAKRQKKLIFWRKIPANREALFQKSRKGWMPKKLAPKLKKLELNCTNLMQNSKNTCSDCTKTPNPSASSGLYVKDKTIRVLLDSGSSGDLLFIKKGSSKHISVVKQVVHQSWGTSNGTFVTNKLGNIKISFVEYLASKKVHLQLDIVEYSPEDQAPMYDLIIGKQTMHDLGVKFYFQEKTITIDKILLLMRNIASAAQT